MVLTAPSQRQQPAPTGSSTPKPVFVVYDQPKVVVVRRFSKAIIPHVNPEEYQHRFSQVLLDTSALLALTRRLNIQDSQVGLISLDTHCVRAGQTTHCSSRVSLDHTTDRSLQQRILATTTQQ